MPISSIFPRMCKQTQISANIYYHTTFSIFLTFLSDFCKNPIGIPDSYRILIILGGDCKVLAKTTNCAGNSTSTRPVMLVQVGEGPPEARIHPDLALPNVNALLSAFSLPPTPAQGRANKKRGLPLRARHLARRTEPCTRPTPTTRRSYWLSSGATHL